MRTTFAYVIIGIIGGFLSGLFGIGGGFIIVPLLMMLLKFDVKRASATSLTAIAVTALAGTASYATHNGVLWFPAIALSIGSVIGSYIGARLLRIVPTVVVLWVFVALVALLLARLIFTLGDANGSAIPTFDFWQYLVMVGFGLIAGLMAGILGVGGGIIVVPLLVISFGLPTFEAKGTSMVLLIPASIVGTLVNLKNRFVDLKAGLVIGVIAGAVSYFGVLVAKVTPDLVGTLLFGVLMLFIAIQFGIRALRLKK